MASISSIAQTAALIGDLARASIKADIDTTVWPPRPLHTWLKPSCRSALNLTVRACRHEILPLTGPRDKTLRYARTCYDHLAGELAVEITDSLIRSGHIELTSDGGALTGKGDTFLRSLGVDLDAASQRTSSRGTGRIFCRPCMDWSERRSHIAGALGAALCQCYFDNGWIRRVAGTRTVTVTHRGRQALGNAFSLRSVSVLLAS